MKFHSKLAVAALAGVLLAGTAAQRVVRHAACSVFDARLDGVTDR